MRGILAWQGRSGTPPAFALVATNSYRRKGVDTTTQLDGKSMERYKMVLPSIGSRADERNGGRSTVTATTEQGARSAASTAATANVAGAPGDGLVRAAIDGAPLEPLEGGRRLNQPATKVGVSGWKVGTTLFPLSVVARADVGAMNSRGGIQRVREEHGEMPGSVIRRDEQYGVPECGQPPQRRPTDRARSVSVASDRMCNYLNAVRKGGSNGVTAL